MSLTNYIHTYTEETFMLCAFILGTTKQLTHWILPCSLLKNTVLLPLAFKRWENKFLYLICSYNILRTSFDSNSWIRQWLSNTVPSGCFYLLSTGVAIYFKLTCKYSMVQQLHSGHSSQRSKNVPELQRSSNLETTQMFFNRQEVEQTVCIHAMEFTQHKSYWNIITVGVLGQIVMLTSQMGVGSNLPPLIQLPAIVPGEAE